MSGWFRKRQRRTPRALLVWETGAGFTHSQNLWGVARHLRGAGAACTIATADPRFASWFAPRDNVLQTFLWPVMRSGQMLPEPRPARALTDILANYGMSDAANIKGALAHYDALFDLARPDIVLCENAFGAQLAARGRIPVITFGSTLLMMPPIIDGRFAPIDPAKPEPSWPVEEVLDSVNEALGASARAPLSDVTQWLDAAAVLPFGPAAFDPYAHARTEPVLPPHCPDFPYHAPLQQGSETIIYLHETTQLAEALMEAILRLPAPVRVYIPALAEPWRSSFRAAGFIIEERMMALELIAAKAACLLHHGGVTLTAAALALGIPQVILARYHENGLAGKFVEGRGLGSWTRADAIAQGWIADAVNIVRADDAMKTRLRAMAPEFRGWFSGDPAYRVACKAAEILGLQMPPEERATPRHALSPL